MLPGSLCTLQGLGHFKLSTRMLSPTRKLLQRNFPQGKCCNWVPLSPPHHWLRHPWETWSGSLALAHGAIHPSDPFGCRQLLHFPATPGAAGAQRHGQAGRWQQGLRGRGPDSDRRQGRTHQPPAWNGAMRAAQCVLNSRGKMGRRVLRLH